MLPMHLLGLIILLLALYGYYISIKKSKLEKEIRKNNLDYECFKCKEKLSIDEVKCNKCDFLTIYGRRKKKFWLIIPIILCWIFMMSKFSNIY